MNIKDILLERYLRIAVGKLGQSQIQREKMTFSCNICGDSNTRSIKRGHLLKSKSRETGSYFWAYKCFNEGCSAAGDGNAWGGENWLKFTSKELHKQFRNEFMLSKASDAAAEKLKEQVKKDEAQQLINEKRKIKMNARKERVAIKHFRNIKPNSKNPLIETAIKFCDHRKIPKSIYENWLVALDGLYKNRLIIPFYSKNKDIYYYQARTLVGDEPKYLNRLSGKDKAIYNLEFIDKQKPVIVVEGPIDSLFLDNAIAIIGASISEENQKILDKFDVYYLFDNDKTGRERSKQLLTEGKNVFLWSKWEHANGCKDINDVIIKSGHDKFSFAELEYCFTNNFYDNFYLER